MALRRLSPREYVVNLVAVTALWPVYGRREWAKRPTLDRFALRRAVEMASMPAGPRRCIGTGTEPRASTRPTSATGPTSRDCPSSRRPRSGRGRPRSAHRGGDGPLECLISTSSGSSGLMLSIPHGRTDSGRTSSPASDPPLGGRRPIPVLVAPGLRLHVGVPVASGARLLPADVHPDRGRPRADPRGPRATPPAPRAHVPERAARPHGPSADRMRALAPRRVGRLRVLDAGRARRLGGAPGAPVRDEYSSEELGRIASQCPEGSYHLHEDS